MNSVMSRVLGALPPMCTGSKLAQLVHPREARRGPQCGYPQGRSPSTGEEFCTGPSSWMHTRDRHQDLFQRPPVGTCIWLAVSVSPCLAPECRGFVGLCRYALQEQLGWGTFGRVYRAVDERGDVWAVHNVNKPSQQAQKVGALQ